MVVLLLAPALMGLVRPADGAPTVAIDRELALSLCAPSDGAAPAGTDPTRDHHDPAGCLLCTLGCATCAACAGAATVPVLVDRKPLSTSIAWGVAEADQPYRAWMVAYRPRGPPASRLI
ncbi:MAG: hypothetical protein ACK50Q_03785 [Labrys sp. (in: a-proteobacteria)]